MDDVRHPPGFRYGIFRGAKDAVGDELAYAQQVRFSRVVGAHEHGDGLQGNGLAHPEALATYTTMRLDPVTGTMRRKALFSMPCLSNVVMDEPDEQQQEAGKKAGEVLYVATEKASEVFEDASESFKKTTKTAYIRNARRS